MPLEGIRVADFTWVWAGPYCTMHLAHLGAEVIKIESQGRVDVTRCLPLYPKVMKGGVTRSGLFNQWNLGKKSLLLNFDKPEGVALVKTLIKKSDVVVDNFATGVMERSGLTYEELKKLKPDLIVASITGYGHTGPQKDYMGYGPAMASLSGMSAMTGYTGGPPEEIGLSLGDPNGGINAAVAICAALAARKRTGKGQYIDMSMWEAMIVLVPEGWMAYAMNGTEPLRDGNQDLWMAPPASNHSTKPKWMKCGVLLALKLTSGGSGMQSITTPGECLCTSSAHVRMRCFGTSRPYWGLLASLVITWIKWVPVAGIFHPSSTR